MAKREKAEAKRARRSKLKQDGDTSDSPDAEAETPDVEPETSDELS